VRLLELMVQRTSQIVQVDRRQVELSNLTKVLYPEGQITKAHLLEYYLKTAPTILAHLKGRPLSLLRFPEGIDGERFFQKNRPDWAPEWLAHVVLGEEKKDYVIATEAASLVWLANLACIELHQMHSREPHFDKPDYVVFDLDPPEGYGFTDLVVLALQFKEHLEKFGYHPFVKTTGRKGLHIIAPIEPKWDFQAVFDAAKEVASPFVDSHASALTLQIKKDYRKGKVLLDIYRNRQSQTIIAAYSVRGLTGAPVSTPLHWEELESLATPKAFNLHNIPPRLTDGGDPWEAIWGYATALHTDRKTVPVVKKELKPARTRKTPEQLQSYSSKRAFDRTPEPEPLPYAGAGSAFVVHRHHASRLHYDLRLERDGVLRSWAVPKGLPPRPGIMRLAVSVEDHPLEYVNFEGVIPKGEYGGGTMWKFAQGRYEISKQKRDGFYFRLHSRELNGEYRIHHTKENQWLLERVDTPQQDWLRQPIEPMLARTADQSPDSPDYIYEVKWDGIRAIVSLDEGELRLRGRNGLDLAAPFPELLTAEASLRATSGVFDGEIVCLEPDGKPNFRNVIHRMQQAAPGAVERARAKHPAVCYLFDCLYLDGRSIVNEPLARRREWLADAVKKGGAYRVSEAFEDGRALLEAARKMGLEGIMAKKRDSVYVPAKRADSWLKIKTRHTTECLVVGYTKAKGDRQAAFGALHLARPASDGLNYVGKVGTGFDDETLRAVSVELEKLTKTSRSVKEKPLDDARSVWVEPKLMCEVTFASITPDGMLREAVFLRLRPDLTGRASDHSQTEQP
jgi:DNA ligase D-like protein (predicted ligase)/DNA ligase D-like protein (predicted polymerase)/DNA ligase D-like protein (predicted 3'-phosphoesterase)